MELRQLECVVGVAEELHFGRAADRLGLRQPTVSEQIARLERELGVVLFDRSSRRVALTDAGRRFVPAAREALAAVERARQAAAEAAPTTLRVGSSTGLGRRLVRVLAAARTSEPPVEIRLESAPTRARLDRVRDGLLDATFLRGDEPVHDLERVHVWDDEVFVAASAALVEESPTPIDLASLSRSPLRLVGRALNRPLVDLVVDRCVAAGFEPRRVAGPHDLQDTMAELGAGADGWTVVYDAFAHGLNAPGVAFRSTAPPMLMPTFLVMRPDTPAATLTPLLRACATAENDELLDT